MEEAVTCVVCSQVYQKGLREPLVLPCGHTFCRSCLMNLHSYHFLCPTCRRDHSRLQIDNLPLCFSLLGLSAAYMRSRSGTCCKHRGEQTYWCRNCTMHGDELKYWCRECKVALCSLCLYSEHQNGHHVHLAKAYIQERKSRLKDHIKLIIDKNVAEKKEEIRNIFYNSSRMIGKLCQKSTFVHDFEEDMKLLSSEIGNVSSIDSLFVSEAKVKHIDMNKLNSLLSGIDSTEAEVTRECAASADAGGGKAKAVTAEEGKTKPAEARGKTEAAEAATQQQQHKQQQAPPANSQCFKLDYRDGRVLLHSLAQRVDTHLFLRFPSEVFLELSVGGRSLGRVYIQLQPNLRHSQQFLLLCLGTMGPSLVGSSINSVNNKNEVTENIVVNSYTTGNINLMTSLESNRDIRDVRREGSVTSMDMGSNSFGFMIWTKGHQIKNCPSRNNYYGGNTTCNVHFPFGEVTSGMKVVLAAIGHNPITQVTITGCGLVIPDHAP